MICYRFGDGYTILIRVSGNNPNLEPVEQYINTMFPGSTLKEKHHNMLQYQLGPTIKLSYIFGQIESVRHEFSIEDYSVSQTTLDQVSVTVVFKISVFCLCNLITGKSAPLIKSFRLLQWPLVADQKIFCNQIACMLGYFLIFHIFFFRCSLILPRIRVIFSLRRKLLLNRQIYQLQVLIVCDHDFVFPNV